MNSIKALLATLGLAAAISPALAATDGLPPNLQDDRAVQARQADGAATAATPQYLHGKGEVSLVPNPAFEAPTTPSMQLGRVTPLRGYVGA